MDYLGDADNVHVETDKIGNKIGFFIRGESSISEVDFEGTGSEDLTPSIPAAFSGPSGEEFVVTIVGKNASAIQVSNVGGLAVNDEITQTDGEGEGTHGTLLAINPGNILIISGVVESGAGFDGSGYHLSNGTVTTEQVSVIENHKDVYTWARSAGLGADNILMQGSLFDFADGVAGMWGSNDGHELGDTFTFTVSFELIEKMRIDSEGVHEY